MLSERRNEPAATLFFAKALSTNGIPEKIVIDKNGANTAGIRGINKILKRFDCRVPIATIRSKYLNNIIEQDHRFIKRRTRPMLGFKSFSSASATLEGIEVTHMIGKKTVQLGNLWLQAIRSPRWITISNKKAYCSLLKICNRTAQTIT